jgi:hypothetical protein
VLQTIGVIISVIGCAVDSLANYLIQGIVTCIAPDGIITGDLNNERTVRVYCTGYPDDCSCMGPSSFSCYFFNGGLASKSCDNILGQYSHNLTAAMITGIITTCLVFLLSIISCFSVCCPSCSCPFSGHYTLVERLDETLGLAAADSMMEGIEMTTEGETYPLPEDPDCLYTDEDDVPNDESADMEANDFGDICEH